MSSPELPSNLPYAEIARLLVPLMGNEAERRASLSYAFGPDSPILGRIELAGAPDVFVNNLVLALHRFGEIVPGRPALWALLDAMRDKVGTDHKQRIDSLRPAFNLPPERLPDRCFISYSRKDESMALRLVSDLTDAGLRVWFDRQKIKGGEAWWQSIEQGIQNADFVIFCLSPDSARSEVANREIQTARALDKRIIPVMVRPALDLLRTSEQAQIAWLAAIHILDFTDPLRYGIAFQELLGALPGYNPPDPYFDIDPAGIPNPFRGLESFREIDYYYFAGREADVQALLGRLSLDRPRMLAVMGPSGSGKSSLVRAGLIPALRQRKDDRALWETATVTPGKAPLRALAERLALRTEIPAFTLRDTLARADGLHDVVSEIMRGKPDGAAFLLVIDQFEEVFTQASDADRGALLATLYHAATVEGGRTYVVLTMRADFLGNLGKHPDIARLAQDNLFLVTEMSAENLRRSIEAPARKVGLIYDDGLIDQILEAVRAQPGSLPLLQYALRELYARREGRRLTTKAYREIGGMQGALATRADSLYNGLETAQRALMKRLLLKLIEVGPRAGTDTRRRVERDDLRLKGTTDTAVQTVLDRLTDQESRLLVAAAPVGDKDRQDEPPIYYEIGHEALITHWARLGEWIEGDRSALQRDAELRRLSASWEANRRNASYLIGGQRLNEALAWLKEADSPLEAQTAFIGASAARRRRNRLLAGALVPLLGIAAILLVLIARPEERPIIAPFNVAVARFTVDPASGIDPAQVAQYTEQFYTNLNTAIGALNPELARIGGTVSVWSPRVTGPVEGLTPAERAESAEKLLAALNERYNARVNVIVYGTTVKRGDQIVLLPEFYNADPSPELSELRGRFALGDALTTPADRPFGMIAQLTERSEVFALITQGLVRMIVQPSQFDGARQAFQTAIDRVGQGAQGSELLQILLGNTSTFEFNDAAVRPGVNNLDALLAQAEAAYREAIRVNPDYARAYAGLGGVLYLRAIRPVAAEEAWADLPESAIAEIEATFQQAMRAADRPETADIPTKAFFGLAQAATLRYLKGDASALERAIAQFEAVIADYDPGEGAPKNPRVKEFAAQAYGFIGLLRRHANDFEVARSAYQQAIALTDLPARKQVFEQALLLITITEQRAAQDVDGALEAYDALLKTPMTDRDRAVHLFHRGKMLSEGGRPQAALQSYVEALAFDLSDDPTLAARLWVEAGDKYYDLGQLTESIQAYERALALDPVGQAHLERVIALTREELAQTATPTPGR